MNRKSALVLCLQIAIINSAPMKMQLLPLQYGMMPQSPLLQLQNPFLRQPVPNMVQSPFMYPQQPIMVLIPNTAPTAEVDDRYVKLNEEDTKSSLKSNTGLIDENKDAVILDADPSSAEIDFKKAVTMMPNGARYSIGTIISYIPFLPIEINVPDTISWISNIWPSHWFGRPAEQPEKRLSNKGPLPVFMMPGQMMPGHMMPGQMMTGQMIPQIQMKR